MRHIRVTSKRSERYNILKTKRFLACPEGLEPPTCCLEGSCSIQLSYGHLLGKHGGIGRGGGIRTHDPLLPKHWPILAKSARRIIFCSAIARKHPRASRIVVAPFENTGA